MTEREIEIKLVQRVKNVGGKAYKFVSPGNIGVPDRIVVFPNSIIVFVELKRPGGKTSNLQKIQMQRLKNMGCSVEIVDSLEKIDSLIGRYTSETKI